MYCEIDLSRIDSRAALHEALKAGLPLPAWYGNNLDALSDVLSEGTEPVELVFKNADGVPEGMRDYIAALRRMLGDVQRERPGLSVHWEDNAMSKYEERVLALRAAEGRHYNCCQSVLIPFAAEAGLDEETAYRLALHFGSGMKRGSVCGAIVGGLMALGLYGADDPSVVGTYYRRLREAHDGLWNVEAENYLLANADRL